MFRDEQGNPVHQSDLRLSLRDFANKGLVQKELGGLDKTIVISAEKLCGCLRTAEKKYHQEGALSEDTLPKGTKKRKRSETPPEEITSSDEARYVIQVERAEKRIAHDDPDYT